MSNNYTLNMFYNNIYKLGKKYENSKVNNETISNFRDDIHNEVVNAYNNDINVSICFPIVIELGCNMELKFFQSGDVYLHDNDDDVIECIFNSYESKYIKIF